MTVWGGRRSRIIVTGLEERQDVMDGFIISDHKICVRCRNVEII